MSKYTLFFLIIMLCHQANAQVETINDSIVDASFLKAEAELAMEEIDSLRMVLNKKTEEIELCKAKYAQDSALWNARWQDMEHEGYVLSQINDTLEKLNQEFRNQLNEKNHLLEEQIRVLQQKEILFAEKEQLYKDAIGSSNVDKAKIEGQVEAKNASIAGKEKEIEYLQKSINEKELYISTKDNQLSQLSEDKDRYSKMSDTLREQLVAAEKELLRRDEELKYTKKRADDAEAKIAQATNRRKKVRVVQGISMRFYPIPEWDIMPFVDLDSKLHNKIVNRNDGLVEFDFITGASVMLYDFTKTDAKFSSDLAVYIGFGGQNLFKNFYFGPSYRFLDFFHLTAGINIAQYNLLAGDYKEGDVLQDGFAIQTKKQWKITPFISLSLDLDFLSYIGKK